MNRVASFAMLALLASFPIGCKSHPKTNGQTSAHASEGMPSWYVTDTGLKVVNDGGSDGFVLADGFWQPTSSIRDKQLIEPIAVKLSCKEWEKKCKEADAALSMGILQPGFTEYAISTWTKDQIVATDSDEGPCKVSHQLVIDFKSRSVMLTDLPSQVDTAQCRLFRDANSYALHGGQIMLFPSAHYDPLAKKRK